MTVSIIVAMSENGVIGRGQKLPWRQSEDLKRFKRLTMGHALVMGRRTFEITGKLPGRNIIVVTHDPSFAPEGVEVVHSLNEALEAAKGDDEIFIGGGGQIFKQVLEKTDRMYVTRLHARIEGDTFFPEVSWSEWREVSKETHSADEKNQYPYTFLVYERVDRGTRNEK